MKKLNAVVPKDSTVYELETGFVKFIYKFITFSKRFRKDIV